MELSVLAGKQKRLKDWMEALPVMVQDDDLRRKTAETANRYRSLLARCWESQAITAKDEEEMHGLERQLEKLNELARMTVIPKFSPKENATKKKPSSH